MPQIDLTLGLYLSGAASLGGFAGWLITSFVYRRKHKLQYDKWQQRLAEAHDRSDQLLANANALKSALEAEKAIIVQHSNAARESRVELKSLQVKNEQMSKDLFSAVSERDVLQGQMQQVGAHQQAVDEARQRIAELQTELRKVQDFHQTQLDAVNDERGLLERRLDAARLEQESLGKQLASAKTEYETLNGLLNSAKSRLKDQEELESQVDSLKADKVQLLHRLVLATQEAKALRSNIEELDSLKAQNSQLVRCLESMDESRKQYESDARRYREQVQSSEKESDTLRFKMDDLEKKFSEMREVDNEPATNGSSPVMLSSAEVAECERDDLQEIVGIGKVFERTLHDLGIFSYRQIAAFETADIARVNAALKEFNGRIEQDDWIGQAKELHYQKYGEQ